VAESDALDGAPRVRAINREHRDTLKQIEEEYQLNLVAVADPMTVPWLHQRGKRPLTRRQMEERRERLIREADERRCAELHALDVEQRLLAGTTPVRTCLLPRRQPIPVPQLTEAVRLFVVERASIRDVATKTGLSRRRAEYVKAALAHGDLAWDNRHRCLGSDLSEWNGPEGVRLPVRRKASAQAESG
jgi:hypothetical protein